MQDLNFAQDVQKFRTMCYETIESHYNSLQLSNPEVRDQLLLLFCLKQTRTTLTDYEWRVFDKHSDFPICQQKIAHDHQNCATMADLTQWFLKTEGERHSLRASGNKPNKLYCLGPSKPAENEFLNSLSSKPDKVLGMDHLDNIGRKITGPTRERSRSEHRDSRERKHPKETEEEKAYSRLLFRKTVTLLTLPSLPSEWLCRNSKYITDFTRVMTENHRDGMQSLLDKSEEFKLMVVKVKICDRILLLQTFIHNWRKLDFFEGNHLENLCNDARQPVHKGKVDRFEQFHLIPSEIFDMDAKCYHFWGGPSLYHPQSYKTYENYSGEFVPITYLSTT